MRGSRRPGGSAASTRESAWWCCRSTSRTGTPRELLGDGAGGIGYLLKERIADLDQLVSALTAVAAGGSVLDPKVVEALVTQRSRTAHSPVASLSPREREVLEAMATGLSNTAIGRQLYLSERAVEKNINQIFGKFGLSQELDVNRRVRAVITYLETTQ